MVGRNIYESYSRLQPRSLAQAEGEQTDGPSRINRRVTVRRITPLLNGGQASLPPPPPGTTPPR
ncbi:hypothetical protein V1280_006011 [Bradyrhizobium sp. AZCC 2230]